MAEAELELRILTGVHAGARALVQQQFVIGADAACDIVLSDASVAARHAEIRLVGDHWTIIPLHPIDGAPPEGLKLPCGARIALGRVLISLDAANAPWQGASDDEELLATRGEDLSPAPDASDNPGGELADDENADEQTPANQESLAGLPASSSRFDRLFGGKRRIVLATSAAGVLIALVFALVIGLRTIQQLAAPLPDATNTNTTSTKATNATNATNAAAATTTAPPERADIARIKEILAQPREGATLRLELQRNGSARVSGFVQDEDQYIALATALSKVQPRPAMRVQSEAEVTSQVVRWSNDLKKQGWVLTYLGSGKFSLAGTATDQTQRDEMFQTVREEFPMLVSLGDEVRLFPDLIARLENSMRDAGVRNMNLKWADEQMELNMSQLTPSQLNQFEDLMVALYRETKGRLRFRVRASLAAPPQRPQQAARDGANVAALTQTVPDAVLPFRIRSISGGPPASIRLEDGRMVMVGGEVDGYILTSINATEFMFEGPTRIVVRR